MEMLTKSTLPFREVTEGRTCLRLLVAQMKITGKAPTPVNHLTPPLIVSYPLFLFYFLPGSIE